ncbi:MAG: hypothetical protein P8X82_19190, partial [Gemmatimonadales bacterium]
ADAFADGSVKGQMQDAFGAQAGRYHGTPTCLEVVGNQAIVGGIVTQGSGFAGGAEGTFFLTSVVDHGTSANDAPDQISFSFWGFPADGSVDCTTFPPGASHPTTLPKARSS